MITTHFMLCAVPTVIWEHDTTLGNQVIAIRSFVEDALGIERRIARAVNEDNERARYNLCCVRLETALKLSPHASVRDGHEFCSALEAFHLPVFPLSAQYLDVIDLMYHKSTARSVEMRLGATFFPPDTVDNHIAMFSVLAKDLGLSDRSDVQRRIAFFKLAGQHDCGVIELQDPFQFERQVAVIAPHLVVEETSSSQYQSIEPDERSFDNEGCDAYDILREQVEDAVRRAREGRPGVVNFSNQPHNVITEVLNEFVYSESGQAERPVLIPVIYTDGSQGKAFPLLCLPQRKEVELARLAEAKPLRVALLSMRHLDMDHDVDVAWFRNREVSKARAFAETDEFCYTQTQKELQQSRSDSDLKLYLYQTGLQPAVVGFYRAVVEELLYRSNQPPSLEVVPYYFRGKAGYRQGQPWH